MNKKLTATILTATLAVNLAVVPAYAETTAVHYDSNKTTVTQQAKAKSSITFSDVKAGDWFYDPVMAMAEMGLIGGTTTPVNGVGTYSPDATMSKAQFVTILTRYLFPEDLKTYEGQYNAYWYSTNYGVAIDKGLIKTTEFSETVMNEDASRQEMALLLVRAMQILGMDTSEMADATAIPDYNAIGTYYKDYVKVAYKEGLIAGTDKAGTFNPKGTLTRAQAATVLNRLIDPSSRTPVSEVSVQPSTPTQTPANVTGTTISR